MDDDEPGFGMRTATLRDYQRKHHAEVTALSQAAGEVDVATSAGGGSDLGDAEPGAEEPCLSGPGRQWEL